MAECVKFDNDIQIQKKYLYKVFSLKKTVRPS